MKFIGQGWKPGYLRQTDRQGRAQPLSFSSLWSFPQDLIKFWMERYLISLGSRDAISQEQIHIRRQSAVLAVATFSSHLQKSTFSGVCCTFPKHTHAHTQNMHMEKNKGKKGSCKMLPKQIRSMKNIVWIALFPCPGNSVTLHPTKLPSPAILSSSPCLSPL